ncbi:MAG: hypothetical protein BWY98_00972 [Tenericutes bacterium ADurb.BinA155]|nr:MAG: hypothetical protein BWY98_00972 [Tenericutes bacterium ADurb.BinA155]
MGNAIVPETFKIPEHEFLPEIITEITGAIGAEMENFDLAFMGVKKRDEIVFFFHHDREKRGSQFFLGDIGAINDGFNIVRKRVLDHLDRGPDPMGFALGVAAGIFDRRDIVAQLERPKESRTGKDAKKLLFFARVNHESGHPLNQIIVALKTFK